MESASPIVSGPAPRTPAAAAVPDLVGLAADLAAKHAAGGSSRGGTATSDLAPHNKGGRRPLEEELADYLARTGQRVVSVGPGDDSGVAEAGKDLGPAAIAPAPHVVTPEFIRTAAQTLLEGIAAWRQGKVAAVVLALTEGDKEMAARFAAEAGAPPGAIEVMSLSAAEIAAKYELIARWSPEAVLVLAAATWIGKDMALMKKLQALASEKKAALAKAAAAKAPAT